MKTILSLALMAMSIIPVSASENVVTDEVVQNEENVQPLSTKQADEVTKLAQALKFNHDQQVLVAKLVTAGACIAVVAYVVYTMYRVNQFVDLTLNAAANQATLLARMFPGRDPHAHAGAGTGIGTAANFNRFNAPPAGLAINAGAGRGAGAGAGPRYDDASYASPISPANSFEAPITNPRFYPLPAPHAGAGRGTEAGAYGNSDLFCQEGTH